jgi:hypothetical protein
VADETDLLRRYYANPALHPERDDVPMLPPLPDRRPELRNTRRPDDPFMAQAREYVGADAMARGAYGLGRTAGSGWDALRSGRYSDATLSALELMAGMAPIPGAKGKGKFNEASGKAVGQRSGPRAEAERVSERGGVEGGRGWVPPPGGPEHPYASPKNQPRTVKIPGHGEVEARPIPQIEEAKRDYMESKGEKAWTPDELHALDPDRARRIAEAFEYMQHNPADPMVRRAYDRMIEETLQQYKHLTNKGVEFRFNEGVHDPYAASPAMGYPELRDRGTLSIFPTAEGFGSGVKFTPQEIANNPLLQDSGVTFQGGKPATVNDVFRAVHDSYGHFGPGNPFFRAPGEERAWQYHALMYGPDARPAMTSETRGQNSWLNFGPHAEHNKNASGADTIYADQKIGILPEFAWTEGLPKRERD